ncbi:hypothetical protein [Stenotrophomonas sp. S39]|uniref:hypothetical protein n=1 Tax=Stenotrophomonas sp. S39 TaxID=2767451 RepID=UPI00190B15A4|nr:hypothetical protein [Stenotrophomonas sp. S39]
MEINFDKESAVVGISMVSWPPPLVALLSGCFEVTEGRLSVDYSHLSPDEISVIPAWATDLPSDRDYFESELQTAAKSGPIAIALAVLGETISCIRSTSSVKDTEAYLSAVEAFKTEVLGDTSDAVRKAILAEIEPNAIWLPWLLGRASQYRYRCLDDRQMMEALVSRTSPEDCLQVLRLLDARSSDGRMGFDALVRRHYDLVLDFLYANVGLAPGYSQSEELDLVFSLFEKSEAVRESREAIEIVLKRAHRSNFPRLIRCCQQIQEEDVSRLFWRWNERPSDEKEDEFRECVSAAFQTLEKNSQDGLPSYLLLAGAWHGFTDLPETGLTEVLANLRLLPKNGWDRDAEWGQLGPSAREAWRQELFDLVSSDAHLGQGLIDFACLWLDQVAFAEVEPVLLRMMDEPDHFRFAVELASRGPRLMRLRAKGLTRSSQGTPDLLGTNLPGETDTGIPAVGARTWLGDPSVERIIHAEIGRVEAEFCKDFAVHWGEDEEVHTGRLMERTRQAIGQANTALKQLSLTTRGAHPSLNVSFRQPSKKEEGDITAAGSPLGADVLFLTRIVDKGMVEVERATLVQVKKRSGTSKVGNFSSTVPFDPQQCEDMLDQTEHSYYLFLTPPSIRSALWVAPARLVGNLSHMHTSKSSIPGQQVRDASCSFADFFLHGLVGLWAGDEKEDIIAIAKGDPARGRVPRLIVEIEIRRQLD